MVMDDGDGSDRFGGMNLWIEMVVARKHPDKNGRITDKKLNLASHCHLITIR